MHSLEIAVFEARDPDGFAGRQAKLHAQLRDLFDGHVASIGLRSLSEPQVFADLVLWESLDAAEAAAAALQEIEDLAWFRQEIGPIRFFDHLQPSAGDDALAQVAEAPVVEVVLSKPRHLAAYVTAHATLHNDHLDAADSVVSHLRLLPNANGITGDVNGWTSADAMMEMAPAMMQRPELAPVFDERNEMMLFMPFTTNVMP